MLCSLQAAACLIALLFKAEKGPGCRAPALIQTVHTWSKTLFWAVARPLAQSTSQQCVWMGARLRPLEACKASLRPCSWSSGPPYVIWRSPGLLQSLTVSASHGQNCALLMATVKQNCPTSRALPLASSGPCHLPFHHLRPRRQISRSRARPAWPTAGVHPLDPDRVGALFFLQLLKFIKLESALE